MTKRTTYRAEIERLRKGIIVAWVINFLILVLTFEAALIFTFLTTTASTEDIITFVVTSSLGSALVAFLILAVITRNASTVMMMTAVPDSERVESGMLFNVVEEMAIAAGRGQHVPDVYVVDIEGVANAFAVSDSKGHSQIIVTEELLHLLNREELQGVIAHEMGHIVSGDSEAMTKLVALTSIVGVVSGGAFRMFRGGDNDSKTNPVAVVLILFSLLFLMVAPILSKLANAYMSRTRESAADASSVALTRDPTALASALMKLEAADNAGDDGDEEKSFNSKVGELAFYAPRLHAKGLRTHPPTAERIQKLREMGARA